MPTPVPNPEPCADSQSSRVTLRLAKEDFKFSSAHFTIFDDESAELLHGHNYQVELRLIGESLDRLGFLVEVAAVKTVIREICQELDERVLVPARCSHLEHEQNGEQTELVFADRRYSFPTADVLSLPLQNITIEELARYLWYRVAPRLPGDRVCHLEVTVGETSGQQASWSQALAGQVSG